MNDECGCKNCREMRERTVRREREEIALWLGRERDASLLLGNSGRAVIDFIIKSIHARGEPVTGRIEKIQPGAVLYYDAKGIPSTIALLCEKVNQLIDRENAREGK